MPNYLLALNCGSSSLKTTLFTYPSLEQICTISASSIGSSEATLKTSYNGNKSTKSVKGESHNQIFGDVLDELKKLDGGKLVNDVKDVKIVTHRIVHGGTLDGPVEVSKGHTDALKKMEQVGFSPSPLAYSGVCMADVRPNPSSFTSITSPPHMDHTQSMQLSAFAPLHNHHAVLTVKAVLEKLPDAVNYCCFDTLVSSDVNVSLQSGSPHKAQKMANLALPLLLMHGK